MFPKLYSSLKDLLSGMCSDYAECLVTGRDLISSIGRDIKLATENGWDSKDARDLLSELERYRSLLSRLIISFGALALLPSLLALTLLARHHTFPIFFFLCALAVLTLALLATFLLWPVAVIGRFLRQIPGDLYHSIAWPAWLSVDAANILINIALLYYASKFLAPTTTLPPLAIVALLWIFLPWLAYMAHKDTLFIKLRIGQLASLLIATLVLAASPVPINRFQSAAQRKIADMIRPEDSQDVTVSWASLRWFTPEGYPNVWFSEGAQGFRLFTAPGHDPDTGKELKPVSDEATKNSIIAQFRAREDARKSQEEAERREREANVREESERTQKEERDRVAGAQEASERARKEERERLVRLYVVPDSAKGGESARRVALAAFDGTRRIEASLAKRVSGILADNGLPNSTEIFTPAFIASADFGQILAGRANETLFRASGFAERMVALEATAAYGRQTTQGTEMRTADVTWRIKVVSLADGQPTDSRELTARGVGFSDADALKVAHERAEAQLAEEVPRMARALESSQSPLTK